MQNESTASRLAKQTAAATESEVLALGTAAANNLAGVTLASVFDALDIARLVRYRRAVTAGFYNEAHADALATDEPLALPALSPTPATHTHPMFVGMKRFDRACSMEHP